MEEIIVKVDGKEYKVKVEETEDGKVKVYCGKDIYEVETKPKILSDLEKEDQKKEHIKEGDNAIKAPLPGTIIEVNVKKGQVVSEGDTLIKLVAMKMENEVIAPKDGKIKTINVKKNDNVNMGDILIVLE